MMARLESRDPDFEPKVHSSFSRQTVMRTLGAVMGKVGPGEVVRSGATLAVSKAACWPTTAAKQRWWPPSSSP